VSKIVLPRAFKTGLNKFWAQLGFWVTIILSWKSYLAYREKVDSTKGYIKVNGKTYLAREVQIVDGHIFIDGEYVSPAAIEEITIPINKK